MQISTLTFFSNYFNHHQKALCDEWFRIFGENFTFVETEPIEGFRANMGWGNEEVPSYVLKTYLSEENKAKAIALGVDSDLVVMGTAPEEFITKRLKQDKLTFRYSERPLKEGFIKFFIPRLTVKYHKLHIKNRKKQLYILAASAYTASDYKKMKCYIDKCYKFGYFPQFMQYDIQQLMKEKHEHAVEGNTTILWTGRMLKLKRPDLLLHAAKRLKDKGYHFSVKFVGDGEEREHLIQLVNQYGLNDLVSFQGFLSPIEAREEMAKANIYVMTSNFLEGWGSVIYEGLNAGC
ncbi:MAG: glycosyltransferase, partial [Clostridia bacterium]|nr:glycosyltransferase [Clostridia bacterium]